MSDIKVNNIRSLNGANGPEISGTVEMNSTGAMSLPRGDTAYRGGRGRGIWGGGRASDGSLMNNIDYITISTTGDSKDFGDLTVARRRVTAASSSTRGLFAGGYNPDMDIIDYVTISSTGNAFDFGNLVAGTRTMGGLSDGVRGLFGSGSIGPGFGVYQDRIDKVTIASKGNASNFGNLTYARDGASGASSPTIGVFVSGYDNDASPKRLNLIDFVTIATEGNAADFGDLTVNRGPNGNGNTTRGVFAGGYAPTGSPGAVDTIDYITYASKGDAIDFGNLTRAFGSFGAASNSIRAVWCGGYGQPAGYYANLEYVTIATLGNAASFGDLTSARANGGVCSDSHGGLG